jgi:hypothetical protein
MGSLSGPKVCANGLITVSIAAEQHRRRADVLILFSVAVQTLGEAWKLGWGVRARCLWGGPDPHSRHNRISIECDTTVRLDMETLVWTRGSNFPLDQLSSRLKCPKCGERRVKVYFEVPGERGLAQ